MNEEIIHTNKLTAIYGRVSSTNQENEGTIETQLSAVYDFAVKHNLHIVQSYLDNGWSGDSIVRPELDKLRMDVKKKTWNTLLIYDPDRLARRYSYQELIMDELREAGVEVLFVTTPTSSNGIEKILYGVQGLFAEYERAKISERFRLGKVRKANDGHIIASEAPYGYTFIPRHGKPDDTDFKQGYYEIHPYESEVVQQIFSWVAHEGLTIRKVVARLHDLEILPRRSQRKVWSTSTLSTLLRNKTYIGEGHFGASYAVVPNKPIKKDTYRKIKKSSRRSKPESEWIKIPTPKIISNKLFNDVKHRLKLNSESAIRNTKNQYLLGHKIWCECGNRRAGEGSYLGKHLYYRCTDRINRFPLPPTCYEKGINARKIDSIVWSQIISLMTSKQLLQQHMKLWEERGNSKKPKEVQDALIMKKEIGRLAQQQSRYNKAYGEGLISIEQLKEYILPLRQKSEFLPEQINLASLTVNEGKTNLTPTENQINAIVGHSNCLEQELDFATKRAIILSVVEKVVATPYKLSIYGRIPVEQINYVPLLSNDRYGRNTKPQRDYSEYEKSIPFEITLNESI